MGDFSVKAILSAVDKNFSSTMKNAIGSMDGLKSSIKSGLGFGFLMGAGQRAFSVISNSAVDLTKNTISTSDSMQKLQQAMRFSGYSEKQIRRIAGATGSLKTYADKTVFALEDVMNTFGALSANGIKDADKMTEAVGNAVAVFGGGAQEFKSVGLAYSQAMAAGALHAQDWNQILNASPQLAGGLRKELIRLNPALGKDFKGAMEKGAISADMLGKAMNNIGMTKLAKEAAQSVTTFEGAMGNMKATAESGMMDLYDTFAKAKVVDGINKLNVRMSTGFAWLKKEIPGFIKKVSPYWKEFKSDVDEVSDAFGDASSAIIRDVGKLTSAFGKPASVKNFADVLGVASGAMVKFAGFCEKHSGAIAKLITMLPKLYVGYKGFKILNTVVPLVSAFSGAVGGLAKKGLGKIAPNLFKVSKGQDAVGKSSGMSSKKILTSAKSFMMMSAGVLMVSGGFYLLAKSAVSIANAGPVAIGVMVGMLGAVGALGYGMVTAVNMMKGGTKKLTSIATVFLAVGASILMISGGLWMLSNAAVGLANAGPVAIGVMAGLVLAIGGLLLVAQAVAPALSAGAVGFVAFGAAVLIAGIGMTVLTNAAINLANAGPLAIGVMIGLVAAIAGLALGAAILGPALTVGAAGFLAFGAAMLMVGVATLLAAAAVAIVAGTLPIVVAYGLQGTAALAVLGAGMVVFGAGAVVAGAGAVVLGAGLAVVAIGLGLVAAVVLVAAAGVLALGAGAIVLGAGLMITAAALMACAVALPIVSAGAIASAAGFAVMLATGAGLSAVLLLMSAGMVALGGSSLVATGGMTAFGLAMTAGAAGVAIMAGSLKLVNSSMKSISKNAESTKTALISMQSSVKTVGSGLDALGNKAKTAMNKLTSAFNDASGKAKAAGNKVGTGFVSGLQPGMNLAPSIAQTALSRTIAAMTAGYSPAYSAGSYIAQGFALGMKSRLGEVKTVAAQLATAADEAVRAKAKIHSPSRVSEDDGAYWGSGWVRGILSKIKDSRKAAQQLIEIPSLVAADMPELSIAGFYGNNIELSEDYSYGDGGTYTIVVPLTVDGKEIAKATATYTENEIEKRQMINKWIGGEK